MSKKKRVATLFMAVLVVGSLAVGSLAGGAAAEVTNLNGDGTDGVAGFNASADNALGIVVSPDGTDFGTDGTEMVHTNITYDGTEYASNSTTVDASTSVGPLQIRNDELSDLPGDAAQNTTVTVNTWGVGSSGDVTTSRSSFEVKLRFADDYAVVEADDDSATIEDVEPGVLASYGIYGNENPADLHTYEQTVGTNGTATTVTVSDNTENGTDAFDEALDDNLESGDPITGASAGIGDMPILSFYQSADSDLVDDNTSYAVYEGDGMWTFNIAEEDASDGTVDVYVSSQSYTAGDQFTQAELTSLFVDSASMSFGELRSNFGSLNTLQSFNALDALFAFELSDLPLIGGMAGGDVLAMSFVAPIGIKARRVRA